MKKLFNLPLVNAHTHAAMVAFRGLAEDIPLKKWLEEHIWPAEKENINPEFIYEQTKKAIREMKSNGIRVFSDMYFFEEEVARAAKEEKIKAVIGEGIMDFPTPSAETPNQAMEITKHLLEKYRNDPYISVAVTPHSIYTLSRDNLVLAKDLAREYDALFHIHLAETKQELEQCLKDNGKTPVEYLDSLKLLDDKTVLAHCVWIDDKDIAILAHRKAKVVHCPVSNLKLGSGVAPIIKMLERGITVALGTDGAASSGRLDIWEEGKIAGLLQKGISHDPSKLSIRQIIEMMTVNGLKALNIKEIDGVSLEGFRNELNSMGDCNFLYELNASELEFKHQ